MERTLSMTERALPLTERALPPTERALRLTEQRQRPNMHCNDETTTKAAKTIPRYGEASAARSTTDGARSVTDRATAATEHAWQRRDDDESSADYTSLRRSVGSDTA